MNLPNNESSLLKRIPSLDGLRAFSILLVILGHARESFGAIASENILIWRMIGNQQLGVSAFFVISGFLITNILIKEYQENKTIRLSRFYKRRALRILPAFYFMLLTVGVLALFKVINVSLVDMISAATFTWNYEFTTKDWWVGHSWSLSVEEQFYLLWPALLLLANHRGAKKWALFFIFISPLVRVANYFLFPEWRGRLSIMLHTRLDTLMFGCLLALYWDHPTLKKYLYHRYSGVFLAGASLFLLIVSPTLTHYFAGTYMMTGGYSLEGLAIAWAIAWFVTYPKSIVGRFLNFEPLMRIGVLSYSLYLWQQLFLTDNNHTILGQFPFNIISVFIMAEFSYRLIERPFLKLKTN